MAKKTGKAPRIELLLADAKALGIFVFASHGKYWEKPYEVFLDCKRVLEGSEDEAFAYLDNLIKEFKDAKN